ncbi:prepilin peptidase [Leptothrix discophora]|uniref:Prepilin leader peptidase/N-methyltransferase n=1 Tax=Leptothrix discophora TaxID=89 RepID=A0ABT9G0D7_LEPDI|nr:A24 family peptidase [Leptothrix discophora]MDP4299762.1 prepilin peptidase [Leptothrix discophora]
MNLPPLELWLSVPVLAVIGLCIGSFLNVVVHRLPPIMERLWLADVQALLQDRATLQRTLGPQVDEAALARYGQTGEALGSALEALPPLALSRPRSRCPACGTTLRWFHNIPVVSWLLLRARCAACGAPISARYPLVEAGTALAFGLIAWTFGPTPLTAVYCVAAALLIAMALIDLDTTLLPDSLTYALLGWGLLSAWLGWTPVGLADAALGVLWGYGALWGITTLYAALRGVRGMAEGDFKLMAALGALLGVAQLLPIILLASAVGAAVGVFLILARNHRREVPIPFGPYLAGGGFASMFFGAQLLRWWLPH